jgi:hypothetical protein
MMVKNPCRRELGQNADLEQAWRREGQDRVIDEVVRKIEPCGEGISEHPLGIYFPLLRRFNIQLYRSD